MPYDVTFTAKALWGNDSRQSDYELMNQGMETARELFEDVRYGDDEATLSRVWATLDTTSGDYGRHPDGRREFFVNVVVRIDADGETAAATALSNDTPALFGHFVETMLDADVEIVSDWRNHAQVEALDRGHTPTPRMPGM